MCNKRNDSIKAKALLEGYKLKTTLPRIKILLSLRALKAQSLSVNDIHQELLDNNNPISRSSIHNTLKELMYLGLVYKDQESSATAFTLTESFTALLQAF